MILCRKKGHIDLPYSMLKPTIKWFHEVTGHPGENKLCLNLDARYYHPEMRGMVDKFKCGKCQKHKLRGNGYGLLPKRDMQSQPFEEVALDLMSLENSG